MSRIGNKPIVVPSNVEVTINGQEVTVKGPKGTLSRNVAKGILVTKEENTLVVKKEKEIKSLQGLHGLTRTLINNMVDGVVNEFTKTLEIKGVGYRAQKQGNKLVLTLGYSHPVEMIEPKGITIEVPEATKIIVKGIDKEQVGQVAADIREKRLPEVYRGKGIKYDFEVIRRKEGKSGKK